MPSEMRTLRSRFGYKPILSIATISMSRNGVPKMSHATGENSMEMLSRRYSRSLLPLAMAAREIGINLRTAHNQISKGVFPVPTILQARRRYVHVEDLAGYIDQLRRTGGTAKK
jgi:hypothetical protein